MNFPTLAPHSPASTSPTTPVSLLLLGAGWSSSFFLPALTPLFPLAATTTSGTPRHGYPTIPFTFDPSPESPSEPYKLLPPTKIVLITFPLPTRESPRVFLEHYKATHPGVPEPALVLLGSTGVWKEDARRDTPVDRDNKRVPAEETVLELGGVVLSLAGLWGAGRDPRNWLARVAGTKEKLLEKGTLHLLHGWDLAEAVKFVVEALLQDGEKKEQTKSTRWILTDGRVYDWWDLAMQWGKGDWVIEALKEKGVQSLPRKDGRRIEGGEFWWTFGGVPRWGLNRITEEGAV